jgi:hypothetical protein
MRLHNGAPLSLMELPLTQLRWPLGESYGFRLRMRRIARLCLRQRRQNRVALGRFYLEQAWCYLRSSAYLLFMVRH